METTATEWNERYLRVGLVEFGDAQTNGRTHGPDESSTVSDQVGESKRLFTTLRTRERIVGDEDFSPSDIQTNMYVTCV